MLLFFDVTSREDFESLSKWKQEAAKHGVSPENTTFVVVGNKTNQHPREVSEQGGAFATQHSTTYFSTSAKTGEENIAEEMFDFVLQDACKRGFYK